MAKLIISDAPDSFPLTVEIQTPNGPATVEFTARHLLATEWQEMREANTEEVNSAVKAMFDTARAEAEAEYAAAQKKPKKPAKAKAEAGQSEEDAEAVKEAAILALIKPVKESAIKKMIVEKASAMIAKIATGWDLDEEFNQASLALMCNKYQGAHGAVFAAYNETLEGLRLGNSKK